MGLEPPPPGRRTAQLSSAAWPREPGPGGLAQQRAQSTVASVGKPVTLEELNAALWEPAPPSRPVRATPLPEDLPLMTSWVDPFDMRLQNEADEADDLRPTDQPIVGMSGQEDNFGLTLGNALHKLGVQSTADLKYLKEQDLVANGIPLVIARKLLDNPTQTKVTQPSPAPGLHGGVFSAEETMKGLAKKGMLHAERGAGQIFCSSFLGGSLLGWGCALTTVVAGGTAAALVDAPGLLSLLTGMVFPVGLSMVLLSGSELLTGNFTTMALPAFTHPGACRQKIMLNTLRVWGISGAGNLAGSLFLAYTLYGLSVVPAGSPAAGWLAALAVKKCSLGPLVAFGKGVGANWLVNVAIFQASTAHTSAGKIASLWLPIMTFVALGLEHSIANMFLLPLGMLLGADVSTFSIVGNILPVAVGNALGAIIFVAGVQRYSLLRNMVYSKPA